jgi:hypothetical protein
MKHIQTPSHTFIAVKLDTTGNVDLKPLDVVKKFSIVVTPTKRELLFFLEKVKNIKKILLKFAFCYFEQKKIVNSESKFVWEKLFFLPLKRDISICLVLCFFCVLWTIMIL